MSKAGDDPSYFIHFAPKLRGALVPCFFPACRFHRLSFYAIWFLRQCGRSSLERQLRKSTMCQCTVPWYVQQDLRSQIRAWEAHGRWRSESEWREDRRALPRWIIKQNSRVGPCFANELYCTRTRNAASILYFWRWLPTQQKDTEKRIFYCCANIPSGVESYSQGSASSFSETKSPNKATACLTNVVLPISRTNSRAVVVPNARLRRSGSIVIRSAVLKKLFSHSAKTSGGQCYPILRRLWKRCSSI